MPSLFGSFHGDRSGTRSSGRRDRNSLGGLRFVLVALSGFFLDEDIELHERHKSISAELARSDVLPFLWRETAFFAFHDAHDANSGYVFYFPRRPGVGHLRPPHKIEAASIITMYFARKRSWTDTVLGFVRQTEHAGPCYRARGPAVDMLSQTTDNLLASEVPTLD